jgi:hypothetical protein
MLQASPEGTAFELAKGRYSKAANFEVYLKGHTGDTIKVDRVSRPGDAVESPALSVCLAVQPDVIQGLTDQATMRSRGFLARFLYSMPRSLVSTRKVASAPVPEEVSAAYRERVLALWQIQVPTNSDPQRLRFSPSADQVMQELERWLEPQLAEGEELAHLARWTNKLAGACARIAAILHVAEVVGDGLPWESVIGERTVQAAIKLGRDYLLAHAKAAFRLMGADAMEEKARQVWESILRHNEGKEYSESAPLLVSRRDIHQLNRRRFPSVQELDPVLDLLVDHYLIRPKGASGQAGRGHKSPAYEVNSRALDTARQSSPAQCTQRTHSRGAGQSSEYAECSESAPGLGESFSENVEEGTL